MKTLINNSCRHTASLIRDKKNINEFAEAENVTDPHRSRNYALKITTAKEVCPRYRELEFTQRDPPVA